MLPSISVIIPVRLKGSAEVTLTSLAKVDYPRDRLEILVVEGTQPAKQRNEAAKLAKGDILYFLDDDSMVYPRLFMDVIKWFCDERIAAVGGPAVTRETDSFLQKCFGFALGSFFGTLNTRYRFKSIGWIKEANEWDLILANLAVRRDVFETIGGFSETLYPNEENELLNRMKRYGYHFIYNAEAAVHRSQRETLSKFVRQVFNYGRGRMEHFLVSPRFFNPVFLAPLAFVIYLLSLPAWPLPYSLGPLALYLALDLLQTAIIMVEQRQPLVMLVVPFLFPLMHVSYALGLFWALVRRLSRKRSEGVVNRIIRLKDEFWDGRLKENESSYSLPTAN